MESRDATFFENIFPMREEASTSSQNLFVNKELAILIEHTEQTLVEYTKEDNNKAPRRSKRHR
jgi:hypothetical protein